MLKQIPIEERNRDLEIFALKRMADIHLNMGKLDLAESELKQVILEYKAIGSKIYGRHIICLVKFIT